MITQEMMQATTQERTADYASVRLEDEARRSRRKTADAASQQSKPSWFSDAIVHDARATAGVCAVAAELA